MSKSKLNNKSFLLSFSAVVGTAAVFMLGYGFGTGDIALHRKKGPAGLPENLDYSSVEQVYDSLRVNYDGELKVDDLMNGLKDGLAKASGDPYTEFLDVSEAEDFDEELSGSFTGIGAELSKDKDVIVIVAPLAGYPAEKAGLRPKDVIAEIDGESAYNLSVTEAVKKIRGPKDTKIKLTVVRDGTQEIEVEITRAEINIPSVTHEILEGNVGYLKISRFGNDTARLSRAAAGEFEEAGVKSVLLDLRSNPGGLLDASVEVASLWLDDGQIILEEKQAGKTIRTFTATGRPTLKGLKTVVLINEGSASASEIVAGALKDHGVATLIGAKTFGKGSVQQLVSFHDNTVLKVTIARWFTPNGQNIDKEGIVPDEKVERSDEDFKNKRDPQKDRAIEILKK